MPSIIRSKAGLLLSALLALTAIVGLAGWWYIRTLSSEVAELYSRNLQASIHLANTRSTFWGLRFSLPNYLMHDVGDRQRLSTLSEQSIHEVRGHLQAYAALPISPAERELLADLERSFSAYVRLRPRFFELVDAGRVAEAQAYHAHEISPNADSSLSVLAKLIHTQHKVGSGYARRAERAATVATRLMLLLVLSGLVLGAVLIRALARHISEVLQGVQRSSSELEGTADTLLGGARQVSTTTAQINGTLQELLAASRQISRTAQEVASDAEQTGAMAQSGDVLVKHAQEGFSLIRATVDELVRLMVNLSNSTQRIGSVIDFIGDLSEQTNILSLNAAIEANQAGAAGLRFGALAEEIRRLADRVSSSMREIRNLVDEVRHAASTTSKATEAGAKAIEASTQQFSEVLATFQQITGRVGSTTEAARQIELSTLQQTSAVEQVSLSMGNLVRTAEDTEASAWRTRQSCEQLAQISRRLADFAGA